MLNCILYILKQDILLLFYKICIKAHRLFSYPKFLTNLIQTKKDLSTRINSEFTSVSNLEIFLIILSHKYICYFYLVIFFTPTSKNESTSFCVLYDGISNEYGTFCNQQICNVKTFRSSCKCFTSIGSQLNQTK